MMGSTSKSSGLVLPGDETHDKRPYYLFGKDATIETELREAKVDFWQGFSLEEENVAVKLRGCKPLAVVGSPEGKRVMQLCFRLGIAFIPVSASSESNQREVELEMLEYDRDILSPPFSAQSLDAHFADEHSFLENQLILLVGNLAESYASKFTCTGKGILIAPSERNLLQLLKGTGLVKFSHSPDQSGQHRQEQEHQQIGFIVVADTSSDNSKALLDIVCSHATLKFLPKVAILERSEQNEYWTGTGTSRVDAIVTQDMVENERILQSQLVLVEKLCNLKKFAHESFLAVSGALPEDEMQESGFLPHTKHHLDFAASAAHNTCELQQGLTEISEDVKEPESENPGPLESSLLRGRPSGMISKTSNSRRSMGVPPLLSRRSTRFSVATFSRENSILSPNNITLENGQSISSRAEIYESLAQVERLEQTISKQKRDISRLKLERNELIWTHLREWKFRNIPKKTLRPFREIGSKPLGEGSFSKVVEAVLTESDDLKHVTKVAVKMIHKNLLKSVEDVERVNQEIQLLNVLRHDNIVHLIEVHHGETSVNLILELVRGGNLESWITNNKERRGELGYLQEAGVFIWQLFSAVDYLHSRNVCHRDIKTRNVLITGSSKRGPAIKLADFGFATKFRKNKLLKESVGTPGFCAPEIFQGEKYSGPAIDIWSVGVVAACLLSMSETALAEFKAQSDDDDFDSSSLVDLLDSLVPYEGKELVSLCLCMEPLERIAASEALKHRFIKTIQNAAGQSTQPSNSNEAQNIHADPRASTLPSERQRGPLPSLNVKGKQKKSSKKRHSPSPLPMVKSPNNSKHTMSAYPLL